MRTPTYRINHIAKRQTRAVDRYTAVRVQWCNEKRIEAVTTAERRHWTNQIAEFNRAKRERRREVIARLSRKPEHRAARRAAWWRRIVNWILHFIG